MARGTATDHPVSVHHRGCVRRDVRHCECSTVTERVLPGNRRHLQWSLFKSQTFQTLAAKASLFFNVLCFTQLGSKLTRKWHEMDDFAAKGLDGAKVPFESAEPNCHKGFGGFCAEQIQSHLGEIEVVTSQWSDISNPNP